MPKSRVIQTNVFGTKSITLDQYPSEAWDWISGDPDGPDAATVKALSDKVPWLYRGLNILVQAVASIPICFMNGSKDIGYLGAELDTPFLYAEDLPELIRHISASLILEGYGYLFRDNAKTIQATKKLWYWNPLSVTFDAKKTAATRVISFTRRVDNKDTPYTSKEIIYFWPEDTYVEIGPPNSSPAKAALAASGVLFNIDQYLASYFGHGAVRATMLAVKGNPPEDEKIKLKKWWNSIAGGVRKAFNTFVMNAETVTPVIIGDGITGLHDTELTKEKREDISTALGIPQSILFSTQAGGLGGAGVTSEDTQRFYTMTVVPLARFVTDVFNKQQFKDTGFRLEVREEEMDVFQEDEGQRATAVTQTVSALADPEMFLIAAAIQGYELSPEVEKQIQALIAKKEEAAAKIQESTNAPADNAPIENPNDEAAQDAPSKAMIDDLARLRRKALKNIGKEFSFESANIPNLTDLLEQIKACTSEIEIKTLFDTNITPAPVHEYEPWDTLFNAMRVEMEGIKASKAESQEQMQPINVNIHNHPSEAPQVTVTPEITNPAVIVNVPEQPPALVSVTNEIKSNQADESRDVVKAIRKLARG